MKNVAIIVSSIFFFTSLNALSATCTAVSDGDWTSPSIWYGNQVPGSRDDVIVKNASVRVVGPVEFESLKLEGRSKLSFQASPMVDLESTSTNLYSHSTVVKAHRSIVVSDSSSIVVANDLKSGSAVRFEAESFRLDPDAVISSVGTGWAWYVSTNDSFATLTQGDHQTRAPGAGGDDVLHSAYNRGGGHGAPGGNSNGKYGNSYGFPFAPFMPGSPNGVYDNHFSYAVRGGGTVWIVCSRSFELYGKIKADGSKGHFGTASGGGVWIAAKEFKTGPRASISATGGEMSGIACYLSRGAGGRVSLSVGLSATELDALAMGGKPEGLRYFDSIGLLPVDIRGGWHPAAGKFGESGTATMAVAKGIGRVEIVDDEYIPVADKEGVRRQCFGHTLTNGVVYWKLGDEENRLRVSCKPNGVLRIGSGISSKDVEQWLGPKSLSFVEAVPDPGYCFTGWSGSVSNEFRKGNPLEIPLSSPLDLSPCFRPVSPSLATIVAITTNGIARFKSPVEIDGKPVSIGLELENPVTNCAAVVEIADKSGKKHLFKQDAEGSFPFVELEGAGKLPLPLKLVRAEIEGMDASVKSVRAVYAHALGRSHAHFASVESRSQPIEGGTVVTNGGLAEIAVDLTRKFGLCFKLGKSNGSKMIVEWDCGVKENRRISVGAQNESYLADFAGLPKGTKFTIPDSYVSLDQQLMQYVRPYLRPYRSNGDMVKMGFDYIADHEHLPGASEHVNNLVFERKPNGSVSLFWDGSLLNVFRPPRSCLDSKVVSIKFQFAPGVEYALKADDTQVVDTSRFELLDLAANPRAKAMKDATFAEGIKPGVSTFSGVPIRIAKPLDSADVAICHQGKGSWALEVDEYTGRSPRDGFGAAIHYRLPARDYVKAHVVFALDPDKRKDRVLTLRLAYYFLNGAGSNLYGDSTLDFSHGVPPCAREIGSIELDGRKLPLYMASVNLAYRNVLDMAARGGYVDFEFIGKMGGIKPQADSFSAFNIFGATLEYAPVTLDVVNLPGCPGNVFTEDEARKAVKLVFRGERDAAKCSVKVKATDFSGSTSVLNQSFDVGPLANGEVFEREIDLSKTVDPGLYKLFIEMSSDNGATDYSLDTRFAILPPSGRVVDAQSSPYATWWFFGSHGSPNDWEVGGTIMQKAGIRKASHHNWPTNALQKFGITFTGNVKAPGQRDFDVSTGKFKTHDGVDGETWFVNEIKKQIDAVPYVDHIMVWHESGPKNGIPEEILDLPVPAATDEDKAAGSYINEIGRIVRKHFPKLRIQIGNNSASLGAACRPLRGGADPSYYDSVGIETPSQTMKPERLLVWGLQGMMMTKEAASYYAKHPVPAAACYEYVYRTERAIGEELQAAWYMRDTLISLANRMPMISPAILFDVRNAYYETLWGRAGMLFRAPYVEPKLSYVAYAALTKALDGVSLVRELDTGSSTAYALLFKRADGKYATAIWCARGEAELAFEVSGRADVMNMVGKITPAKSSRGAMLATSSEFPSYILTDQPIEKISITRRTSSQAANVASGGKEVFRFDDLFSVSNAPDPRITSKGNGCLPMMRPSKHFNIKTVADEEKGACLEVSLDVSKEKVNRYYTEYTTLRLNEPVEIAGPCESIGIWVKGNSNWGQIRFEIVDRDGEDFVNYSHATLWDTLDWQGMLCVDFDGWAFVNCRFDGGLKYDSKTGLSNSPWNRELFGGPGSNGKIDFPIKLKAVTVGMNRMKLGLTDFKPSCNVIRLGPVLVK